MRSLSLKRQQTIGCGAEGKGLASAIPPPDVPWDQCGTRAGNCPIVLLNAPPRECVLAHPEIVHYLVDDSGLGGVSRIARRQAVTSRTAGDRHSGERQLLGLQAMRPGPGRRARRRARSVPVRRIGPL